MTRPLRLLFVCTGNTCRSPLAEALARTLAEERGWDHVTVSSAGISTLRGLPASEGSVAVARARGVRLEEHTSTPLTPELVEEADLILVMTPGHRSLVEELGGEGKTFLLGAFATGNEEGEDAGAWAVPDPFGQGEEAYRETLESLEKFVERALARLAEERETER